MPRDALVQTCFFVSDTVQNGKRSHHCLFVAAACVDRQLRLVKSSVYLTGVPTEETKKRMVRLLAPSRRDVVRSLPLRRSSSLTQLSQSYAPSSRRASESALARHVDLVALVGGDGGGGGGGSLGSPSSQAASMEGYRGVLRDDRDNDGDDAADKDRCFKQAQKGVNSSSEGTEQSSEDVAGGGAGFEEEPSVLGGPVWIWGSHASSLAREGSAPGKSAVRVIKSMDRY